MRIALGILILLIYGCNSADTQTVSNSISRVSALEPVISNPPDSTLHIEVQKSFESLFDPMLADGFDFAVGNKNGKGSYVSPQGKEYNGWYIAVKTAEEYSLGIHTGEDWNGVGGGDTDLGQIVHAIGNGIVSDAGDFGFPWGNTIVISHKYIENAEIKDCQSLYAHLDTLTVQKGDTISRRQSIGTIGTGNGAYPAHLHLEIRKPAMKDYVVTYWPSSNGKDVEWVKEHYFSPNEFIKNHRQSPLPSKMKNLVIACKTEMEIHYFESGIKKSTYNMAVGQSPIGHKEQQGDNKTPEGAYKLIQKSSGPFSGSYADYFGTGWMRISYPNSFDAHAGFEKELISKSERDKIIAKTKAGQEPPKTTTLGGGIGIHGWSGTWDPNVSRALTWGCISINNNDLTNFYKQVPINCEIYILP